MGALLCLFLERGKKKGYTCQKIKFITTTTTNEAYC